MLHKPAKSPLRRDPGVSEKAGFAGGENPTICSVLREQALPAHSDAPDHGSQRTNGVAPHLDPWHEPRNVGFDFDSANNLNHNTTLSSGHDSYWNFFLGTEAADASSSGYSNGLDPFSGFDIPFWFDQEQHWDFT
jgi:hypothetical protein